MVYMGMAGVEIGVMSSRFWSSSPALDEQHLVVVLSERHGSPGEEKKHRRFSKGRKADPLRCVNQCQSAYCSPRYRYSQVHIQPQDGL